MVAPINLHSPDNGKMRLDSWVVADMRPARRPTLRIHRNFCGRHCVVAAQDEKAPGNQLSFRKAGISHRGPEPQIEHAERIRHASRLSDAFESGVRMLEPMRGEVRKRGFGTLLDFVGRKRNRNCHGVLSSEIRIAPRTFLEVPRLGNLGVAVGAARRTIGFLGIVDDDQKTSRRIDITRHKHEVTLVSAVVPSYTHTYGPTGVDFPFDVGLGSRGVQGSRRAGVLDQE